MTRTATPFTDDDGRGTFRKGQFPACHAMRPQGNGPNAFRMCTWCHDKMSPRKRLAHQISIGLCNDVVENDIFRALADPTRRAIFDKLAAGRMNASALRKGMEISQPAMSQHLSVLRSAKLVRQERQGRFVNYEIDPEGLAFVSDWLAKYRAYWPTRVAALKALLKDMDQ